MGSLAAFALAIGILAAVMALAWAVAQWTRNGGWADTFWSSGVGLAGVVACLAAGEGAPSGRPLLAALLIAIWSVRLAGYLAGRTIGRAEDARYAELRREWGAAHAWRLFLFLEVQALAAVPLVLAVALAAHRPGPLFDAADLAAVSVFALGVVGGGIADRQLAAFKARTRDRDRVCDEGLWALSRHPNYFFEWVGWLAWPVMAFAPLAYPQGLAAVAAPALMYYLLVHVSGVPLLEAHMARSRPAAFAAYAARTPVFFPRLPSSWPFSRRNAG